MKFSLNKREDDLTLKDPSLFCSKLNGIYKTLTITEIDKSKDWLFLINRHQSF